MRACLVLGILAAAALSSTVHAQTTCDTAETAEWSYEGNTGPNCWGQIASRKYLACALGRTQSPIVLSNPAKGTSRQTWAYRDVLLTVKNTGHSIELPFRPGSSPATQMVWTIDGKAFVLQQIHFHVPSEHMFEKDKPYPMEAHFVHTAADRTDRTIAVRAILFRHGEVNWMLQGVLFRALPTKKGEEKSYTDVSINPTALIRAFAGSTFFQYRGSLTTPGCDPRVYWRIDEMPTEASPGQIEDFRRALGFDNNRPVQTIKEHKIEKVN